MSGETFKSVSTLESELKEAKSGLKNVDENIKQLVGREPSNSPPQPHVKRDERDRRRRIFLGEDEERPNKRTGASEYKRFLERSDDYEDLYRQQKVVSKVIVASDVMPSRQEALAAQNQDEELKARNKRMFGVLVGTLQKFQQEEIKLKHQKEKRDQLEKRIEENQMRQIEEMKRAKKELYINRKKKQEEIKMIELKMKRMKEYTIWEESQRPTKNFIQTKAKPHVHFLPSKMNHATNALLQTRKNDVEKMIVKKRQEVMDEFHRIEEKMNRKNEYRKTRAAKYTTENPAKVDENKKIGDMETSAEEKMDVETQQVTETVIEQNELVIQLTPSDEIDEIQMSEDQTIQEKTSYGEIFPGNNTQEEKVEKPVVEDPLDKEDSKMDVDECL